MSSEYIWQLEEVASGPTRSSRTCELLPRLWLTPAVQAPGYVGTRYATPTGRNPLVLGSYAKESFGRSGLQISNTYASE